MGCSSHLLLFLIVSATTSFRISSIGHSRQPRQSMNITRVNEALSKHGHKETPIWVYKEEEEKQFPSLIPVNMLMFF